MVVSHGHAVYSQRVKADWNQLPASNLDSESDLSDLDVTMRSFDTSRDYGHTIRDAVGLKKHRRNLVIWSSRNWDITWYNYNPYHFETMGLYNRFLVELHPKYSTGHVTSRRCANLRGLWAIDPFWLQHSSRIIKAALKIHPFLTPFTFLPHKNNMETKTYKNNRKKTHTHSNKLA
jgi:hypothetical protein